MPAAVQETIRDLEQQIAGLRKKLAEARSQAEPEPVGDYTFATTDGPVTLSELFGDRRDLLVIHNMGRSCAWCTLWADGFNGHVPHLESRTAFVLTSPDDPETQRAFATERGWTFRIASTAGTTFTADMGYEPEPGKYWPGVSAFHRREDGTMVRTGHATFGPGDEYCGVWHFFDLLADGPADWSPRFSY